MSDFQKSMGIQLKTFDSKRGEIEAVVTSYGNFDKVNDVIKRGALDSFMKNFGGMLPMLFQHNNSEIVGEWTKFYNRGDEVIGVGQVYTEMTKGSDVMALVSRGMVGSTSIGFKALDYDRNKEGGYDFKEIELVEVSLVQNPANPKAEIQSVKRDDGSVDVKALEKLLRDAGLSRTESKALLSDGQSELRDAVKSALEVEDMHSSLLSALRG